MADEPLASGDPCTPFWTEDGSGMFGFVCHVGTAEGVRRRLERWARSHQGRKFLRALDQATGIADT